MHVSPCCGCNTASDYGTSIAGGQGTQADPFTYTLIDPAWVRPVVRVRRTTNQSIPNNTLTAISFDTQILDTDNMFTPPSTLITINTSGLFLMGACGRWNNAGTGNEFYFRKNGVEILDRQKLDLFTLDQCTDYLWFFSSGDTLELLVLQNSGVAMDLEAEADNSIVLWMCYVGRKV